MGSGAAIVGAGARVAWRVVETKRHRERLAQTRIAARGLRTYLPLLRQWPRPAVGAPVGPMFPGYVFVALTSRDIHPVTGTPGVRGLVHFGGVLAELDDAVVELLRAREGADGTIAPAPPAAGSALRITDGPLRGFSAVLERRLTARQRVLLLLEILQRQTRVEIPEGWVRRA